MVERVLTHPTLPKPATGPWVVATAASIVTTLERSRATWQVWHVRAEAERRARAAGIGLRRMDHTADQVVDTALTTSIRLGVLDPVAEPRVLRRDDGQSVYDVRGATRYTSASVLEAEQGAWTIRSGGLWTAQCQGLVRRRRAPTTASTPAAASASALSVFWKNQIGSYIVGMGPIAGTST